VIDDEPVVNPGIIAWTMPGLPAAQRARLCALPICAVRCRGATSTRARPPRLSSSPICFATQLVSPGCVGLAAQQVGVAARVFSLDVSGHVKTRTCHGLFALCNAVVVSSSRASGS